MTAENYPSLKSASPFGAPLRNITREQIVAARVLRAGGMPPREIAKKLGVPGMTVRSHLYKSAKWRAEDEPGPWVDALTRGISAALSGFPARASDCFQEAAQIAAQLPLNPDQR